MLETVVLKTEGRWWCLPCTEDLVARFGSEWKKYREALAFDDLDKLYAHLEQLHKIHKSELKLSVTVVKLPHCLL